MKPDSLSKHGWNPEEWQNVADNRGVPMGRYKTPFRPASEEVEIVRKFLIEVQKNRRKENTEMGTEKVNMSWIAGTLKLDPKISDTATRCLIDVGMSSAIPVGAQKGPNGLADKLARFRQGDFIKLVAMIDPYGVKQADGTWKNGVAIRVTEIKTEPPKRAQQQQDATGWGGLSNDDIPY